KGQAERAQRDAGFETASRLMYGAIPAMEGELAAAAGGAHAGGAGPGRAAAAAAANGGEAGPGGAAADGQVTPTGTGSMVKEEVGPDDVADVVSAWTGIPAGRVLGGGASKTLRME